MSFVECKAGRFEGIFKDNCHIFNGIPYAKYQHRWDQSQLLEEEINIQAFEKGYSAPQTRFNDDGQTGPSFFQDNSLSNQAEDCLTLNVATNDTGACKPVMIWIHGGALVTGLSLIHI